MSNATRRLKQYAGIAGGSLGLTRGRAPVGPLHAQIGICDPCNHRCVMCWDHPPEERHSEATAERFGYERPGLMSLATFRTIVDDLHALGTRRIDLVGRGEPLLNPAVVDIVAHAKARGMLLVLCTNASKLSPDIADRFVALGLDRTEQVRAHLETAGKQLRLHHLGERLTRFAALRAPGNYNLDPRVGSDGLVG